MGHRRGGRTAAIEGDGVGGTGAEYPVQCHLLIIGAGLYVEGHRATYAVAVDGRYRSVQCRIVWGGAAHRVGASQ